MFVPDLAGTRNIRSGEIVRRDSEAARGCVVRRVSARCSVTLQTPAGGRSNTWRHSTSTTSASARPSPQPAKHSRACPDHRVGVVDVAKCHPGIAGLLTGVPFRLLRRQLLRLCAGGPTPLRPGLTFLVLRLRRVIVSAEGGSPGLPECPGASSRNRSISISSAPSVAITSPHLTSPHLTLRATTPEQIPQNCSR